MKSFAQLPRSCVAGVLLGCALLATPARAGSGAPDEVGDLIEQGRQALEKKHFADAQRIFDAAAAKDGSTLRTKTWVIRAWMEDGRINDSLNAIDALDHEGLKGPAMDYLYGMAFALKARGYLAANTGGSEIQMALEDAVQFLERAVKADPELARDAFLPLAEAAWYAQKLEIARPAADQAVLRAPANPDAQFMLGRIALSQYSSKRISADRLEEANANWETARKALAKAAELLGKPESPALADQLARIRVDLGHTYAWKEKLDEAQREYAEAISWKPSVVDLPRVRSTLGSERFLGALEIAAGAIASHPGAETPEVATIQWWLGWARFEQKQYEKADDAFSAAVAKWPGYTNAWYYIMLSRYHRQDYEGAVAAARRHFDVDPADLVASIGARPETDLKILDFLAGWLSEKDRFEEAATLSEIQAAVEPGNARYWNNVGVFRRDAGAALRDSGPPEAAATAREDFEKSWAAYSKALAIEPDNPAYLNDAAVILHYYLDREPAKAKAMYEKAAERAVIELEKADLAPELRELYKTALRDSKNNLEKLARGEKRE